MSGCRSSFTRCLPQSRVTRFRSFIHPRVQIVRPAVASGTPADTSGKIPPDNLKASTGQASSATPDSRQSSPPASQPVGGPAKSKGSWTPPYPSLINNKPLPTEDVKTNIDM